MTNIAIIDFGTNTFHLKIVRPTENNLFVEVFKERHYVHLAADGIATIGAAAFERALNAANSFQTAIGKFAVVRTVAVGTAAMRTATNGEALIKAIEAAAGIVVHLIDGDAEARLIYDGVRLAYPFTDQMALVMDVGGGSVEFILANQAEMFWAKSYPIGVAVLYKLFHKHDPLLPEDITALRAFLDDQLADLVVALQQYAPKVLVGASGAFDMLENAALVEARWEHAVAVALADVRRYHDRVVAASLAERLAMPDVPNERAVLVVVALSLIGWLLDKAAFRQLVVSNYALKEGLIWQLMNHLHAPK